MNFTNINQRRKIKNYNMKVRYAILDSKRNVVEVNIPLDVQLRRFKSNLKTR